MKAKILTSLFSASLLLMSGCNSSSNSDSTDGSSTNNQTTTNTAKVNISSENDAKKAVEAINAMEFSNSITSIGSSLSGTGTTSAKQREKMSQTIYCLDSGTVTFSGDFTTSSMSLNYLYDNCVQKGVTSNGAFSMSGSFKDFTIAFNDFYVDSVKAKVTTNMTMKESISLSNGFTATLNGKMDYLNKQNNNEGYVSYSDFVSNVKISSSTALANYNGDTTMTSSLYPCIDGTYSYKTISDLTIPLGSNKIESGVLEINDAVFTFNNGEVEVTTKDGATYKVELDAVPTCN